MWIERTNEHQAGIKIPGMSRKVRWSDKGTANVAEDDARLLIDAGHATPVDDDATDDEQDE